jgi:hypothetical protein
VSIASANAREVSAAPIQTSAYDAAQPATMRILGTGRA